MFATSCIQSAVQLEVKVNTHQVTFTDCPMTQTVPALGVKMCGLQTTSPARSTRASRALCSTGLAEATRASEAATREEMEKTMVVVERKVRR